MLRERRSAPTTTSTMRQAITRRGRWRRQPSSIPKIKPAPAAPSQGPRLPVSHKHTTCPVSNTVYATKCNTVEGERLQRNEAIALIQRATARGITRTRYPPRKIGFPRVEPILRDAHARIGNAGQRDWAKPTATTMALPQRTAEIIASTSLRLRAPSGKVSITTYPQRLATDPCQRPCPPQKLM